MIVFECDLEVSKSYSEDSEPNWPHMKRNSRFSEHEEKEVAEFSVNLAESPFKAYRYSFNYQKSHSSSKITLNSLKYQSKSTNNFPEIAQNPPKQLLEKCIFSQNAHLFNLPKNFQSPCTMFERLDKRMF